MLRLSGVVLLLLSGIVIGMFVDDTFGAAPTDDQPGFLIVVGKTVDAEGLDAYVAAAGGAISNAGLHRVARSARVGATRVLEGSWPYEGFVAIEQFESWERLSSYWHSDEFQQIKKLREGKIDIEFVVAVEALPIASGK